jgi:DNA processing protein
MTLLKKHSAHVILESDPNYPVCLKTIPDAPVLLYVQGNLDCFKRQSIALVGSRRPSMYGQRVARKFGAQLAERGVCVVSGFARGIDAEAHSGALDVHGLTAAVLGCGLSYDYPSGHGNLREKILQQGVMISEFGMTVPPAAYNFPRRNRIISGLSAAVVVIEAAQRSGALITADFANEQGRDVMAVPGHIDEGFASGCHELIQQGAQMVTSVQDIFDELNLVVDTKDPADENPSKRLELTDSEYQVFQHIRSSPRHFDEVTFRTGLDASTAGRVLGQLEFKKLIRQLPGKFFRR